MTAEELRAWSAAQPGTFLQRWAQARDTYFTRKEFQESLELIRRKQQEQKKHG